MMGQLMDINDPAPWDRQNRNTMQVRRYFGSAGWRVHLFMVVGWVCLRAVADDDRLPVNHRRPWKPQETPAEAD